MEEIFANSLIFSFTIYLIGKKQPQPAVFPKLSTDFRFRFHLKRVPYVQTCTYHVTFTYHVQLRAVCMMTSWKFCSMSHKPVPILKQN